MSLTQGNTKYVFVLGGVVSGLGKGITAASLGRLLKARGYEVTVQKFDPYFNIDPGTMNPIQHGEVFVTEDGAETDLDLGHYERFIDVNLAKNANVTAGKIYSAVLERERRGEFGGGTVQFIPHITDEIKSRFYRGSEKIAIIEVGGTVGDMESSPFLEAIRQFQNEVGHKNAAILLVTLIPYLKASGEMKTKPTQACVRELQGLGLRPDVLVCRSDHPLTQDIRDKLALFCNVRPDHVLQNLDADSLYQVPLMMEEERLAEAVCETLNLWRRPADLSAWRELCKRQANPRHHVEIALVGKYTRLHDSYLSVVEALKHAGIANEAEVSLRWVDSELLTPENVAETLCGVDGVLVPGGFGSRGVDGMLYAIRYAREKKLPFLGLCLGMQLALVEFARNCAGLTGAHSVELDPDTPHPVIHLMPDQEGVTQLGGTLRLGAYPCVLKEGTTARALYGAEHISERHRHRYEVNNDYCEKLEAAGLCLCGHSPDGRIVEMLELPEHPFFLATQAHPEFKSRPNHPHPLFTGLIAACLK